jgi:hypothetical protein
MGRNLCGGWPVDSVGTDVVLDLLPTKTVGRKVLLAVPGDLRLTPLAAFDLIAKVVQPDGQLRSVDVGGVALRGE